VKAKCIQQFNPISKVENQVVDK